MTFIRLRKISLIAGLALYVFFGIYDNALAVVPTWDNGLSGAAPQFVSGILGAATGWFTSKEYSNLVSFSLSDLIPSWDAIASYAMRLVMDKIRDVAFSWIQNSTGNAAFEGSPMFIQDPSSFFDQVRDQAAGAFLDSFQSALSSGFPNGGNLCAEFGQNILNMLPRSTYGGPVNDDSGIGKFGFRATCSINDLGNLTNFYQDFSNGGWDSWQSVMHTNNNPYGVFLAAIDTQQEQEAKAQAAREMEAQWSSGYQPVQDCLTWVYPPGGGDRYCDRYQTHTPGKAVGDRVQANIASDITQAVQADEISEIVDSLIGLLSDRLQKGLD